MSDSQPSDASTASFASDPLASLVTRARGDLALGTQLAGRFRIEDVLGRGGMGVVYSAWDTALDEPVAIKVVRPDRAPSAAGRERFLEEVRLARRIAHPGIVRIFELGSDEGAPFVAMERLEGSDLGRLLRERSRPISVLEALDWIIQACDALEAAHEEGIVHRDIKPTNLFLTNAGGMKVLDFGLAAAREDRVHEGMGAAGTPAFMAPEQRAPARHGAPTPATDVWALARVLTELLSRDQLDAGAPPSVPPSLAATLASALADDPRARPASAGELGRALRACAASVAPRRFPLRRLAAIAGLGAALIVAGAATVDLGVERWWRAEIETAIEERALGRAAALALAAFPESRGRERWFLTLAATVDDRGHALLRGGRLLEAIETFQLARALGAESSEGLRRAREARAIQLAARRTPPTRVVGSPASPAAIAPSSTAPPLAPATVRVSLRSAHAAAIYVDGRSLGLTPFDGELPSGLHRIRYVDLDSGRAHDEIVTLAPDTPLERTWPTER